MESEKETKTVDNASRFDCNICLETAKNAVICVCGHLFCWPCLHLWMLTPCDLRRCCPVCRTKLDITKIIPLYGRNSAIQDLNDVMAPRPQPLLQEPNAPRGSLYFGFLMGFQTSFGYGSFPMETMVSVLNLNDEQALFFLLGLFCIGWLLY
ncbi:hypothetical protein AWZ03_011764 [Drosophila navojoa]|uniref:RING-type E3 ubiquitin transferase n=1 Tax=Drosophila navojoa TaxID=7232 RepID=A0A484AYW0_DRONA|nr:hypothetical protein AWZ03_011764 [Drosophila navojoa]